MLDCDAFKNKVFLAPMAGITDKPMRKIVFEVTKGKVSFVSEMVAVNALSFKNAKTYRIADTRDEPYDVIVQLMGSDPLLFADAAKLVTDLGASGIDINMGCPVRKVLAAGGGACLMKDEKRAGQIIESTRTATPLPVSVKFRKGWDNEHINAVQFAKMCENAGATHIAVHGRTKAQGYSGIADWDIIRQVKENVKIPVIGNGDVTTPQNAKKMLDATNADAVMIGRASLGDPWLLQDVADYLSGHTSNKKNKNVYEVLKRHMNYLVDYYGQKIALGLSRKYICWYSKNFFEAKKFRETYMKITNFDDAMHLIDDYFKDKGENL